MLYHSALLPEVIRQKIEQSKGDGPNHADDVEPFCPWPLAQRPDNVAPHHREHGA